MTPVLQAAGGGGSLFGEGTQTSVLIAFLVFVGAALLLCVFAGPDRDEVADFYTANRSLTPLQNGLALSGDYISAATMLGTTGIVALSGFDGIMLDVSTALALGTLLVLARPLRNAGRYTLGDIFALRAPGSAPRIAAAVVTLAVSLPFLVVQLAGAGAATAMLLGLTSDGAQQTCIALIGTLMVFYTVLGGMRGTSLMQIVKVVLTIGTFATMTVYILSRFHWSPDALLTAAAHGSGHPDSYLRSTSQLGVTANGPLNIIGLHATVVLGAACMPHMIMRVNAAPDGATARRSTRYALGMVGVYSVALAVLGIGAAALVGAKVISAVNPNGQAALLLLAGSLAGGPSTTAGSALFTAVACTVFVTVLAVVAGITLAAAAALAHDVHAHAVRRGRLTQVREVRAVRWAVLLFGVVGILVSVAAQGYNVQFLSMLAVTVAASAVLPALVHSLFWRGYNGTGLLWSVYGGAALAIGLQLVSPTVSGGPGTLFPDMDFAWSPLQSAGLVSVPAGFLLGWAGSRYGRRRAAAAGPVAGGPEVDHDEVELKVLTGVGSD
ncbi:sodium/solute symporter [Peterkaempfera griseoplana]|uniref:sodium/solute symporter n=1 Tax=Peterkaempfera griseoplana TaxID=66896 RepID=UPI0007C64D6D|nr:cation acetate symporter [Peterkaempfera griseoplana]